jgi:hypothetical protein
MSFSPVALLLLSRDQDRRMVISWAEATEALGSKIAFTSVREAI